jgi:hypothetical protein
VEHRWRADCIDSPFYHIDQSLRKILDLFFKAAFSPISNIITGVHPFQVPQLDDVLRIAKHGDRAFPELKLIGWDVALCENGIFLMEGNNLWDPDGAQITFRRVIKKEMMALIE